MKLLLILASFALTTSSSAFAATKSFSCLDGEDLVVVDLDTNVTDPQVEAGTLSTDHLPQAIALYIETTPKFEVPADTTIYFEKGLGDGDTDFYYLALPKNLANMKKNTHFSFVRLERNDQDVTETNPTGITQYSFDDCIVDR